MAGTIRRNQQSSGGAGPVYFTQDVANDFTLMQDTIGDMIVVTIDQPTSQTLVTDPLGSGGAYLIIPVADVQGSVAYWTSVIKLVFSQVGNADRTLLQTLGFIYVPSSRVSQVQGFLNQKPFVYYFGTRRNTPVFCSNQSRLIQALDIFGTLDAIGEFNTGTNKQTTGILFEKLVTDRAHFGGAVIPYVGAALTGISSTSKTIGTQVQQSVSGVMQGIKDALNQLVDGTFPAGTGEAESLIKQLDMANFATVVDIQALNTIMLSLGVKAATYIDLISLAKLDAKVVASLGNLKSQLSSAVATAQIDPNGPGAQVAQSDAANQSNLGGR